MRLQTFLGLEAIAMRATIALIWGLTFSLWVRPALAALIGAVIFYLLLLIRPKPKA